MTQKELNQKVASQTGETVEVINAMGFSHLQPVMPIEERRDPLVVDWDEVDSNPMFRRII